MVSDRSNGINPAPIPDQARLVKQSRGRPSLASWRSESGNVWWRVYSTCQPAGIETPDMSGTQHAPALPERKALGFSVVWLHGRRSVTPRPLHRQQPDGPKPDRLMEGVLTHQLLIELTNEVLLTATKLLGVKELGKGPTASRRAWRQSRIYGTTANRQRLGFSLNERGNRLDLLLGLLSTATNTVEAWSDTWAANLASQGLGITPYCGYQPLHVETAKWMVELRALPKEQRIAAFCLAKGNIRFIATLPRSSPRA